MTAIGMLFREIRGELSFRELARTMELGHAQFCKIENGRRTPSVRLIKSLALRAGLSSRQLDVLLACQEASPDVELARLCWKRSSGAALRIANVLLIEFECTPATALAQAESVIASTLGQALLELSKANIDSRQLDLLGRAHEAR